MNRNLFNSQLAQYATHTVTGEGNVLCKDGIKCYFPELDIQGNTIQNAISGKNLIDPDKFAELIISYDIDVGALVERDGRRCVTFRNNKMHNQDFTACCPTFKENTRYIFSFECLPNTPTESSNSLYMGFKPSPIKPIQANTTTEFTRIYAVNNANTTVTDIALSFGSAYMWLIDLDTVYLYEYTGETDPAYEKYTGRIPSPNIDYPQLIQNASNINLHIDGTVTQSVSVPSSVLLVDGAMLTLHMGEGDTLAVNGVAKTVTYTSTFDQYTFTGNEVWNDISSSLNKEGKSRFVARNTLEYYNKKGIKAYCNISKVTQISGQVVDSDYGVQLYYVGSDGGTHARIVYFTLPTMTLAEFKQWLKDNPTTLRYEIETPIEYDLTDTDFGQQLLEFFIQQNGVTIIKATNDISVDQTITAKYLTHA